MKFLHLLLLPIIALTLQSCSGIGYSSIADTSAMTEIKSADSARVYAVSGYKPVSSYKAIYVSPVQTLASESAVRNKNKAVHIALEAYFYTVVKRELANHGYILADSINKDTVELNLLITGLKPQGKPIELKQLVQKGDPLEPYFEEVTMGYMPDLGRVKIEGQFVNGVTGKIEVVAVVNSSGGGFIQEPKWNHVIETFDAWAKGFAKALDEGRGR